MKVLLLGAFEKGALENYYVEGLQKEGLPVVTYDIATPYYLQIEQSLFNKVVNKVYPAVFYKPINDDLQQFIVGKKYDVILVFKGLTLFPETIISLKEHTRLLCCYNPDHPFNFFSEGSGNSNILNSITHYDLYITYAKNIAKELQRLYKVASGVIPFGFDSSALTKTDKNTVFADQLLFIGAYDKERTSFLSSLESDHLAIYGDQKWGTRNRHNAFIRKAYKGRSLYDDDYKTAINTSKGVLNLLRKQNIEESSHNMRTFEVPGYGGLLITNRTDEQMAFFEGDKEAVFFDTVEELKEKLQYLDSNPKKVMQMKQAAMNRSFRSDYSYAHRSRELYKLWISYLA